MNALSSLHLIKSSAILWLTAIVLFAQSSHPDTTINFINGTQIVPPVLSPFTQDGCSLFPDGNIFKKKKAWRHCCIIHDITYWIGGTWQQRKEADQALAYCVGRNSNSTLGKIMEKGVRIGGGPIFLGYRSAAWFRWGYGWNINNRYYQVSEPMLQQIFPLLEELIEKTSQPTLAQLWKISLSQLDKINDAARNKKQSLFTRLDQ